MGDDIPMSPPVGVLAPVIRRPRRRSGGCIGEPGNRWNWPTGTGDGRQPRLGGPSPPLTTCQSRRWTRRKLGAGSVVNPLRTRPMRRPLIVTGRPGSGKSALAHMISRELGLGRVLRWSITSRTTLQSGLYEYDAFGRAQAVGSGANTDIGNFVHLGALGTALLPHRLPRVLLVDELDKSDIDLPNDLLSVFEEGEFSIKELVRVRDRQPEVMVHAVDPGVKAPIRDGIVRCRAFPIIVITSNGEREFPPALLRRCLTLNIPDPDVERLCQMVAAHFQNNADGVDRKSV